MISHCGKNPRVPCWQNAPSGILRGFFLDRGEVWGYFPLVKRLKPQWKEGAMWTRVRHDYHEAMFETGMPPGKKNNKTKKTTTTF